MQKYLHMAPFFSAWALNNLKNKEEDGSQNITSVDETRLDEQLGGRVPWAGIGQLIHPVLGILGKQSKIWAHRRYVFPIAHSQGGKEAELNSVYSIILYKITNQIRQLVHFPRGEERRVLCLWRSIFPHRNKEQEKGFIPPTTQATFFAELYL